MKKVMALAWALVTLLPVAYMVYFISYVFFTIAPGANGLQEQELQFYTLAKMHIATIVLTWLLIAGYVTYLFRTSYVAKEQKALWAVVLIMGNIMAMPVFWVLYVWKPLQLK